MHEVTSHLVYLHSISIVSTNFVGLQSRALLYMTAEGTKSCNESLVMTPVKYYSLATPQNLGMRPP